MYSLNNIDKQNFLSQYWQKKPLVIKQGLIDFIDPLDENDLAGLSLEPNIDSRIVSHSNNQWQVTHGPFDDVNAHCLGAWSLLVQSVDHFIPEADLLMRAFDFIPHWRMDDLMVSFSNEGAGVGPHLDQYDVFIIQGKGSRRWQVGLPGKFEQIQPHKDLSQINAFEAVIDEILQPGDIIYIPPGHPHNGIALESCLNYSVGFRAPSQQEMLSSLADFALDNNVFTQRYTDKQLSLRDFSGEIKQQEIIKFKELLQQVLSTDQFSQWTAEFLSQSVDKQTFEDDERPSFSHQFIIDKLKSGEEFYRSLAIKPVFIEQELTKTQEFTFYIQGEEYAVPAQDRELVINFLSQPIFSCDTNKIINLSVFFTQLLTTLVNSGFWYLEDI